MMPRVYIYLWLWENWNGAVWLLVWQCVWKRVQDPPIPNHPAYVDGLVCFDLNPIMQ